ncbi:MAG TPA: hypothetical protein QGI30_05570 [Anaerolineales bacterium]|jgi:hypothetical protein|nr:hypothetical protein [Anaerolineales bacterium]|tara:strand:+ start:1409 stop:1624 length:216 start_codon:yes stop_codon:yes gene_type:complete
MNNPHERYLLRHELEKAQAALDTAQEKLDARFAKYAHVNQPSGYSVKRWTDSVELHQRRVTDVQNRLGVNG